MRPLSLESRQQVSQVRPHAFTPAASMSMRFGAEGDQVELSTKAQNPQSPESPKPALTGPLGNLVQGLSGLVQAVVSGAQKPQESASADLHRVRTGCESTHSIAIVNGRGQVQYDQLAPYGFRPEMDGKVAIRLLSSHETAFTREVGPDQIEIGLPRNTRNSVRINELAHELHHADAILRAQNNEPGYRARVEAYRSADQAFQEATQQFMAASQAADSEFATTGSNSPQVQQDLINARTALDDARFNYENDPLENEARIAEHQALQYYFQNRPASEQGPNDAEVGQLHLRRAQRLEHRQAAISTLRAATSIDQLAQAVQDHRNIPAGPTTPHLPAADIMRIVKASRPFNTIMQNLTGSSLHNNAGILISSSKLNNHVALVEKAIEKFAAQADLAGPFQDLVRDRFRQRLTDISLQSQTQLQHHVQMRADFEKLASISQKLKLNLHTQPWYSAARECLFMRRNLTTNGFLHVEVHHDTLKAIEARVRSTSAQRLETMVADHLNGASGQGAGQIETRVAKSKSGSIRLELRHRGGERVIIDPSWSGPTQTVRVVMNQTTLDTIRRQPRYNALLQGQPQLSSATYASTPQYYVDMAIPLNGTIRAFYDKSDETDVFNIL